MPKKIFIVVAVGMFALCWPLTVHANSSWIWLTQTTPLTILPYAITGTLAIEILTVIIFEHIKKRFKAAAMVSNRQPCILYASCLLFKRLSPPYYSIIDFNNAGLYYIVAVGYLVLTLLLELPIVYGALRRDTDDKAGSC